MNIPFRFTLSAYDLHFRTLCPQMDVEDQIIMMYMGDELYKESIISSLRYDPSVSCEDIVQRDTCKMISLLLRLFNNDDLPF